MLNLRSIDPVPLHRHSNIFVIISCTDFLVRKRKKNSCVISLKFVHLFNNTF